MEKAFDHVPHEMISLVDSQKERSDEKRSLCNYRNFKTSVKIIGKQSKEYEVKVGVHQGSVHNLLFAVVMDEITKDAEVVERNFFILKIWCCLGIAGKKQKQNMHSRMKL